MPIIQKSGDKKYLNLPKELLILLGWKNGDVLNCSKEGNKMIVERVQTKEERDQ